VEFALVLPLLLLMIVNVVNFGGLFFAWITVSNSVRAGADYLIMGSATVGGPASPSIASVQSLVTQDLVYLPNSSGVQVRVCVKRDGTVTCSSSPTTYAGSTTLGDDPESSTLYVSAMVEVNYTYSPLIPVNWGFIPLTTPPTSIHRTAMMRLEGGSPS
jgi:Flp pilus assembly protein TadG